MEVQRCVDDLDSLVPVLLDSGVSVVIDHFGLPGQAPIASQSWLAQLGKAPLWVKLSAAYRSQSDLPRAQQLLAWLCEAAGGIDHLLWGSDWPHTQFEEQTDYAAQFAFFEALLPDPEERRQILVDNPARLFDFVR
ncbi:4-sulfomuconolactone hydrolase [compost metagenome]